MSGAGKKLTVVMALLAVSAAMVYGTWLAVDDMRAKPMVAQVTVTSEALCVVNDSGFLWQHPTFTINKVFVSVAPHQKVEPGARQCLPLDSFVEKTDGRLVRLDAPVREVAAVATRPSRFRRVNAERRISARWTIE